MDWNLLESKAPLVNTSFHTTQPLSPYNLNQWAAATSTSFDQFTSYNFVQTPLEDQGFHSWKMLGTSYDFVPPSSVDLDFEGSKMTTTLEKGPSQMFKGLVFEGPGTLSLKDCIEGVPDCGVLGLDQDDDIFMLVHGLVFLEITSSS